MDYSAPNPLSCSKSIKRNMFVSKNYIEKWRVEDAIREVLQNQYDGINLKIGGKSNILVIPKGTDKLNAYEFEMRDKVTNEIYGEITYDEDFKELVVWNIGSLESADLLFGCEKEIDGKTNEEIIGRFGEGMKLAALTFLKNNIKSIINTDEEW